MGLERDYLPHKSVVMAEKLVREYNQHEAIETEKEVDVCRACPYSVTCKYSYHFKPKRKA